MTAFEERSNSPAADWREALDTLERSLREALQALAMLRWSLEGGAPETHAPASASGEIATSSSVSPFGPQFTPKKSMCMPANTSRLTAWPVKLSNACV